MPKKITLEILKQRVKAANIELFNKCDYSQTKYNTCNHKISVICIEHGEFIVWPGDHMRGMSGCKYCISDKRRETNIKKYGVDNIFKRSDLIANSMKKKYGVENPGQLPDHVDKIKKTNNEKYGMDWSSQSPKAREQRRKTNLSKYGTEHPMQNNTVKSQMMQTKIQNGSFTRSNSSKEATEFIRNYVLLKGYNLSQCAFASETDELYEWGIYDDQWILYDLVVGAGTQPPNLGKSTDPWSRLVFLKSGNSIL